MGDSKPVSAQIQNFTVDNSLVDFNLNLNFPDFKENNNKKILEKKLIKKEDEILDKYINKNKDCDNQIIFQVEKNKIQCRIDYYYKSFIVTILKFLFIRLKRYSKFLSKKFGIYKVKIYKPSYSLYVNLLKDQSFKGLFQKTVFMIFTDKKDEYVNQNKNYNSLILLLERTGDEFLIALTESTIMELMPLFYESPELKEFTKKEKSIYLNEEFLKQKKTTLFTFEGFKEYISHDYTKKQTNNNRNKKNDKEDKWAINEIEKIFKMKQSNEALVANQIVKDQI
jgi:hypothetical protein